jgi:hypothetical protein
MPLITATASRACRTPRRGRQLQRFARAFDYDWFGPVTIEGSAQILPALPAPAAADDDDPFTHR